MDTKNLSHIELDEFWPYHAVVLANLVSKHTHSLVKTEADLNLSQWRVLAAIAEKPERTAADVTNITPMDKTIVSRAVSSLIKADLIKKEITKTDKRCSSLQTTHEGQKAYEKIALRLNETMIASFLDKNEGAELVRIFKKISSKMRLISSNAE